MYVCEHQWDLLLSAAHLCRYIVHISLPKINYLLYSSIKFLMFPGQEIIKYNILVDKLRVDFFIITNIKIDLKTYYFFTIQRISKCVFVKRRIRFIIEKKKKIYFIQVPPANYTLS